MVELRGNSYVYPGQSLLKKNIDTTFCPGPKNHQSGTSLLGCSYLQIIYLDGGAR